MRNVMWATECGPIVGVIRNGKKYLFGSEPDEEIQELKDAIELINETMVTVAIQDEEPIRNNTIWIKPYQEDNENMLILNNTPNSSALIAEIDATNYGVTNSVRNESQLTNKSYTFEIIK